MRRPEFWRAKFLDLPNTGSDTARREIDNSDKRVYMQNSGYSKPVKSWSVQSLGLGQISFRAMFGTSATNIYVVGARGTVYRYDGSSWASVNVGTSLNLRSVCGTSSTDIYIGCDRGVILHYDGSTWSEMDTGTLGDIVCMYADATNGVYAVSDSGVILQLRGSVWEPLTKGIFGILTGIWVSPDGNIYAIAYKGLLLEYDGSSWSRHYFGRDYKLLSIWGISDSDIYISCENGKILHFDGTSWTSVTTGVTEDLFCIHGSSASSVFAVGAGGRIIAYNGTSWSTMSSGITNNLYCVWAFASDRAFAAGTGNYVLDYNGTSWVEEIPGESPLAVGLYSYYKFNTIYASWANMDELTDSSGNGRHGFFSTNSTIEAVTGKVSGEAAKFVQSDHEYPVNYGVGLAFHGDPVYAGTPPLSFQIWFQINLASYQYGPVVAARQGAKHLMPFTHIVKVIDGIGVNSSNELLLLSDSTFTEVGPTVSLDTWYHCVVVCTSDTQAYVYLNNVKYGPFTRSVPSRPDFEYTTHFSRSSFSGSNTEWTNTTQDEYAFWTRALSDAEVSALWNGGLGRIIM